MKNQIKCTTCRFCKSGFRGTNVRIPFYCNHENQSYILQYFKEHHLSKMPSFLCFSKRFEVEPSIKTSPSWCPLKKEERR